ncbi:MAG: hypothetical protein VKO21_03965 [Candidatus Sericytochromatia bacterium]|nr:hypothetical protein [Candidatus Sericytochromatia bacterium]
MRKNRPDDDALWQSLATVAEAYGAPPAEAAALTRVLGQLDPRSIPPELAAAVAETLGFVFALDQQAEGRPQKEDRR